MSMGTVLGVNYICLFFLMAAPIGLYLAALTMLECRKNYLEIKNRRDGFNYDSIISSRYHGFLVSFVFFIVMFFIFNFLIYRVFIDKTIPARACIAGDIFIMDNDNKFILDKSFSHGFDYIAIASNEPTVNIEDKQYELVKSYDYNDMFCRSVVDVNTGWNIYMHTGNIVNGKVIEVYHRYKSAEEN